MFVNVADNNDDVMDNKILNVAISLVGNAKLLRKSVFFNKGK